MLAEAVNIEQQHCRRHHDIIVVGSGPVGMRFVQLLMKLNAELNLAVFGDEPWQPYNRVQLSSLVSGEIKEDDLYASCDITDYPGVNTFYNNRIVSIDRYNRQVIDSHGKRHSYNKLILATGSRPRLPMINGIDLDNVFTFRDLNDAQSLMGRSVRTRRTVIIGGGLLGLEAARAMQRFNTEVHVVEHSMWLMFRQLDNRAGSYLKRYIESLGIHVHLSERVQRILGDARVSGVLLGNGEVIDCDTVVVAAGIESNSMLAMDAGLHVGKGIRVDDHLQTSDRNIFAIGECVEHRNKIYGLVAPGFEQAAVLAHALNGENTRYQGSVSAANLKVLDYPVFSVGNTGISARSREVFIYQDHRREIYRKIVVINGRIRGAVGIGDWPGVHRFQEAVEKQRRIWPWQISRFREQGVLWNDAAAENVIDWPATATVCNCTGVTRGQLDDAMRRGACTVIELATATGASTVCGSCKNLVADYVSGNASPEPATGFRPLLLFSLLAVLLGLAALLLPAMQYHDSVQLSWSMDMLWRDSLLKQISGFSLLGLSLLVSLVSVRKRVRKIISLWDFAWWRLAHVGLGVLVMLVLLAHTGFRLGDHLNFYLMLVFCGLLLVGAVAGVVIGYEHRLPARTSKRIRSYAVWSHILLLWPLPALLGFHILKTYYF
jgi:nitrite reductase (NADH) large subunit